MVFGLLRFELLSGLVNDVQMHLVTVEAGIPEDGRLREPDSGRVAFTVRRRKHSPETRQREE